MSKLQKWCPNHTQFCTLAEPGRSLNAVPRGTPRVSPPLGAQFLCWHQSSLGEYPALTPRYWFSYLPAYYRGGVACNTTDHGPKHRVDPSHVFIEISNYS